MPSSKWMNVLCLSHALHLLYGLSFLVVLQYLQQVTASPVVRFAMRVQSSLDGSAAGNFHRA